jgi:hypothetical protein
MRPNFGLFCGFILLTIGALLVNEASANTAPGESLRLIAGASLLALGLIMMWLMAKGWWEWRKVVRKYRGG